MIEELSKAYKTPDGRVFQTRSQARLHKHNVDFDEWYESNQIPTSTDLLSVETLKFWLISHPDKVKQFLSILELEDTK